MEVYQPDDQWRKRKVWIQPYKARVYIKPHRATNYPRADIYGNLLFTFYADYHKRFGNAEVNIWPETVATSSFFNIRTQDRTEPNYGGGTVYPA